MTRHLHLDNRDQIDYYTPSASLFQDYCDCLINRYDLSNVVQKATVTSIRYGTTSISTEGGALFTLTTSTNQVFLARTVVVAVGPGKPPSIPAEYKFLGGGSASHIFDETAPLIPRHVRSRKQAGQSTTIAVVGGGLTSAQIVYLLLAEHNIDKVYLILRSKLKVKHFDVDLEWVSKFRNANMAAFWSADTDEERFEMLRCARGGGSVPPKWAKLMRTLEKGGKLQCLEDTQVVGGVWSEQDKSWDLEVEVDATTGKQSKSVNDNTLNDKQRKVLPQINHVICATGLAPGIHNVDCLTELSSEHPVPSIAGLPQLDDDLRWSSEVPLFLTGALAGLRLGPGAGNLAGARLGAERVAWGIERVLSEKSAAVSAGEALRASRKQSESDSAYWSAESSDKNDASDDDERRDHGRNYAVVDRSEFTGGFSNQFEALAA